MDFLITPYKSVGSIEFGMTQSDVQELFTSEPHTITHRPDEICDIYEGIEEGIHIFYTKSPPYICNAVMLYPPSKASICSFDFDLLETYSIKKFREIFEGLGFTIVEVGAGGISIDELGIYLSTQNEEIFGDDPPESVVAFVKGYYESI